MTKSQTRLAIILPHPYRGGTVRLLVNVIQYFQSVTDFELVLGLPLGHFETIRGQLEVLEAHKNRVEIRSFEWKIHPTSQACEMLNGHGVEIGRMISSEYCSMVESHRHFLDCDFWFFISDRIFWPLLPLRPYGVLVTDHLQRYVPEIFDVDAFHFNSAPTNFLRNVRNANIAIATSTATVEDLRCYSGARGNIIRVPTAIDADYFLSLLDSTSGVKIATFEQPYFVWVTNTAQHKNHLRAIEALNLFFEEEESQLQVVITGANTDMWNPELNPKEIAGRESLFKIPYVKEVREAFREKLARWLHRIHFVGEVPDSDYLEWLRGAQFLWHNVIADNGTFSVIEAAVMGTPSLSSSYPQMLEINELFGLGMAFFDPRCARSAADALLHCRLLKRPNPAQIRSSIQSQAYRNWGPGLKDAITASIQNRMKVECL